MFRRIARIVDTGVDLLDVKAQLVMRSFERVGMTLVGYVGACLLLVLGVGILLAACIVALAPAVGVAWALVIVGAATLALGGAVAYLCSSDGPIRRRHREALDRRSSNTEQSFVDAIRGDSSKASIADPGGESELFRIVRKLASDPATVASAGFALVSLIGLKRTMRLISAGTMLASLLDSFQGDNASDGEDAAAPTDASPTGSPDDTSKAAGNDSSSQASKPRDHASNRQWRDTSAGVR